MFASGHITRGSPVAQGRTIALLCCYFWWPGLNKDAIEFDTACQVCNRYKNTHPPPAVLFQPLVFPARLWSHVALDFVSGLPVSRGKSIILTVVERFSKAQHLIALPKLASETVTARLLFHHVFGIHGPPLKILSDRGPQFTFQVWMSFCLILRARSRLTSGFHPPTNGQRERLDQELENALHCLCATNPTTWSL